MAPGRRPAGPKLVEGMNGTAEAKERAAMILKTIAGECGIDEACAALNLSPAHFHRLRESFLQAGLESLAPRPLGRPPLREEDDPEKQALRDELRRLRIELVASQTREEIALAMPHILRPKKKRHSGSDIL